MRLKLRVTAGRPIQMEETDGKDPESYHRHPDGRAGTAPRNVPRQPAGLRSPAPIDHELGAAAVVHPYARAIPAPAVPFGAARVGHLIYQAHLPVPADIDLAHLVALLVAVALQANLAIPTRAWTPAAAIIVVMPRAAVAIIPAPTSLHELSATAAIHP